MNILRQIAKRLERKAVRSMPRIRISFGEDPLPHQLNNRVTHAPKVREPLVLITQIQRSGGTLLSQLFDGHPQLYAYPAELTNLKSLGGKQWFRHLTKERRAERLVDRWVFGTSNGYQKQSKAGTHERKEMFLSFNVYKKILRNERKWSLIRSPRECANQFFTAFFGSWLDRIDFSSAEKKKFIVAFSPRAMRSDADIVEFFRHYPDGYLIFIVRSPLSWYASAQRHSHEYSNIRQAARLWREQAELFLRLKGRFEKRIVLINFEDLVSDARSVMKRVSAILDIAWDDTLLQPTFNGSAIFSDSAFEPVRGWIDTTPRNRSSDLADDEIKIIEAETYPVWNRFSGLVVEGEVSR